MVERVYTSEQGLNEANAAIEAMASVQAEQRLNSLYGLRETGELIHRTAQSYGQIMGGSLEGAARAVESTPSVINRV